MKVTITYYDNEAFTVEEVVKQAVHHYGRLAQVEVMPESTMAYDHILFGLQQLITHEQLSLWYDSGPLYPQDLKKLKDRVMYKVYELLNQVVEDNEAKLEK